MYSQVLYCYMPTKKTRVGFIPRSKVLEVIKKLSFESNLSIAKIINILVEEALHKRGLINIKSEEINNNISKNILNNGNNILKGSNKKEELSDNKSNFPDNENLYQKDLNKALLDTEIYEKFLLFLQFQEKIKKNLN